MIARIGRSLRKRVGLAWRFLLSRLEPGRWIKKPGDMAGHEVCLLVSYTATGVLSPHTLAWCEAWHRRGFKVILVVAMDAPSRFARDRPLPPCVTGLLLRRNIGYDFGSWVAGLEATPGIHRASLLAMTNDSVYGPLDGFDAMLARVHASAGEIVGVAESFERLHHLQSFLVFYTPAAMKTAAFRRFWRRIPLGGREEVIFDGELRLLFTMLLHGLKVDILFPSERSISLNPTLFHWRELLDAGFPFVKIQLLRDNPKNADIAGWETTLRNHGYDPALVREHLGAGFAKSAAGRALSVSDSAADPASASNGSWS